jgi:6-pyruvoyltetrahydropterin/6-carboxytetrahydropterin synthase
MNIYGEELSVVKIFDFCYAHHLPEYQGKCANIHGHNCQLHVEVNTNIKPKCAYEGMIIDFNELKEIINKEIIDELDHKYLNEDVAHFKNINPTAENMVIWIVSKLEPIFGNGLARVRFYETPTSYAEWVNYE